MVLRYDIGLMMFVWAILSKKTIQWILVCFLMNVEKEEYRRIQFYRKYLFFLSYSYNAPLTVTIAHQVNDGEVVFTERRLGQLPIMVGSNRCHLSRMSPEELVKNGEEVYELGGYFICNGLERLIRLLQVPRRHVILAIDRSSFTKRGPAYTSLGCQIKCVKEDMSSVTLTLHYLRDGRCRLRWSIKKQEFLVPVVLILKALKETSDREIYEQLTKGDSNNTFLSDRLELLLRESKNMHLY